MSTPTENQPSPAPPPPSQPPPLPPPPAPRAAADGPQMSTAETLSGIFFEPGRTFEALRARPRFLAAALLCLALFMGFYLLYMQRIGYENIVGAETEVAAQRSEMSEADRERARNIQLMPAVKAIRYASPPLVFAVVVAIGAAVYLLGSLAAGKKMTYRQSLAVWSYSSLPPLALMTLANVVLLFASPPAEPDEIARGLNGLVHANGSVLVDSTARPVLATLLGFFDLLAFYGLFLGATGLSKVARMTSGAAWTVVIVIHLIALLFKLGFAAIMGQPLA